MVDQFDVVLVCTGNVCRSPMMEHLLRRGLTERGGSMNGRPWRVRSAGIRPPDGAWTHELALEALEEAGIHVAPRPARSLEEVDASSADLILVATTGHRAEVVSRYPSQVPRTFTLLQFARWCAAANERAAKPEVGVDLDGDRILSVALGARSQLQPAPPPELDLPDPMGAPLAEFTRTARRIEDALADVLGPGRIPALRTGADPVEEPDGRASNERSVSQIARRSGVATGSVGTWIRRRV